MKISVVIATKNEEKNIKNCLESVKRQKFSGEIEVIIVDNSQDKTYEIAQKYTEAIYSKGKGRSAQRNFGIAKSSAEWFIFLDADMILSKNVIKQCVNKIENQPGLVALYIPEMILGHSFFNKIRNFERGFYNATPIDGIRFIKKKIFWEAGGFDERLYAAEDWDLTKKVKKMGRVSIISAPIFHNERRLTLKKYLTKKRYYSQNIKLYIAKWGRQDEDIKRQFGFYYRFLKVFLEKGKWKKALSHPILMVGVYLIKTLTGFTYFFSSKNEKK